MRSIFLLCSALVLWVAAACGAYSHTVSPSAEPGAAALATPARNPDDASDSAAALATPARDPEEASDAAPESGSGAAAPNPADGRRFPSEWARCGAGVACVLVRDECCDNWSVASVHATEAAAFMARLNAPRQCRRSCADPGEPMCVGDTCTLRRSAPQP